mgnify:CR=1 FL=1
MNSQDILRNLGISLDIELDNSETYDYEIAGFDGDYDKKVIDFTNTISFDVGVENSLNGHTTQKICIDLCEIDNTPNDPNYIYSGITQSISFEEFTDHFDIKDSDGNILHDYQNFILNNDVFTYTGYEGEVHYFKICGFSDCLTPTATPEPTLTPTNTPNPTTTPEPTSTCVVTTQYLNVELNESSKFKISLWIDDQYSQPDSAECDYIVSGQARGDMGTVYDGTEIITHGDHIHQFNLSPILQSGEVVTGFTVYSVDTTLCECPTNVDITPWLPPPPPTSTPTPTPLNILNGLIDSFNDQKVTFMLFKKAPSSNPSNPRSV